MGIHRFRSIYMKYMMCVRFTHCKNAKTVIQYFYDIGALSNDYIMTGTAKLALRSDQIIG